MIAKLVSVGFRFALHGVVWVFLLSISWEGRTLYDRAYEVLVDNEIVATIDGEVSKSLKKFMKSLQVAYLESAPRAPDEVADAPL